MSEMQMVKTDRGAVNARILAKEAKADFRRVEAASLKIRTHLTSAEAKRLFVRVFHTLQLNAHFVSVIARTRLDHQDVEAVEAALRADIEGAKDKLNEDLDGAEALFKANGINSFATYDTQPLELDVGILSSSGRRYLEVFNLFDQLMPLLQTLEIHEVISTQALDRQRAVLKRQIKNIATSARRLAAGLRRRMNAMDKPEGVRVANGLEHQHHVDRTGPVSDQGSAAVNVVPADAMEAAVDTSRADRGDGLGTEGRAPLHAQRLDVPELLSEEPVRHVVPQAGSEDAEMGTEP